MQVSAAVQPIDHGSIRAIAYRRAEKPPLTLQLVLFVASGAKKVRDRPIGRILMHFSTPAVWAMHFLADPMLTEHLDPLSLAFEDVGPCGLET